MSKESNTPSSSGQSRSRTRPAGSGGPQYKRWSFLGLSMFSVMAGPLAITSIAVIARDISDHTTSTGVETSLIFALFTFASAAALPYSARLAHRWGTQKSYAIVLGTLSALFFLAAVMLAAGAPRYVYMIALAPFVGALQGLGTTLAQVNLQSFSPKKHLQQSVALYGGLSAVALGLGSPVSAAFVDWLGPVPCLALHGLSFLPLLIFVRYAKPITNQKPPKHQAHPWKDLVTSLRNNSNLRIFCGLGVLASFAFWPLTQMMIPLAASLGHQLLIHAGILSSALAFGSLASSWFVRILERSGSRANASLIGWSLAAAVLLTIGLVAILIDDHYELLVIAPALFLLGAFNNAARSFVISSIEKSKPQSQVVSNLATFFLATALGMPIGTLLWGQMIDTIGASVAIVASATVALAVMLFLYLRFPNPEHESGVV